MLACLHATCQHAFSIHSAHTRARLPRARLPPTLRPLIRAARVPLVRHVQGERFTVSVPPGAGAQIEVIVPARCLPSAAPSEPSGGAFTAAAKSACGGGKRLGTLPEGMPPQAAAASSEGSGGGGGDGGDVAWTLCRRFDVTIDKPPGASLGLALAPSRAGHLTVTDVTPGGLAASVGTLQLGDMIVSSAPLPSLPPLVAPDGAPLPSLPPLVAPDGAPLLLTEVDATCQVSMDDEPLSANLDAFVTRLQGVDGELILGVQRVEDDDALALLLEQVKSRAHI